MEILMTILPFVPAVIIAIALIALLASGYVKAPPDVAYIISGLHKKPRILVGKAGIKIPFLERLDKLALGAIQIDVKTGSQCRLLNTSMYESILPFLYAWVRAKR